MIARQQWEKEQRRASILRAAEKVFAAKGAALVTMDDIAHEADVGKGTLYLYFESKDELYHEIANRTVGELVEVMHQSQHDAQTGHQRVAFMLSAAVGFALAHRDPFRVAVNWMGSDTGASLTSERFAEYRRLVGRVYAELSDALDAGKHDGSIVTTVDTPTLVAELLGVLLGALLVELNARNVAERVPLAARWEGLAGGVMRLVLSGLRLPATADEADPADSSSREPPVGLPRGSVRAAE
jgi:AcrR family transcriptional regulator